MSMTPLSQVHLRLRSTSSALQKAAQIFNVGSNDQNCTLGELGRLIQTAVPKAELQFFERECGSAKLPCEFQQDTEISGIHS